jgi:rod shape-determining protein MreB
MYRIDLGIDLGTSNVRVFARDKGVVIDQPSYVAYEEKTKNIIAVGAKAKRMLGKTPEGICVTRPIQHGVISDYMLAERMIKALVKNAMTKRKFWGRPTICVCIPGGVTEVERRAVEDAVVRTGAKQVFVLESSIAAAIGADMDIMETYGHMIVDIGGGTTDVAVISSGGLSQNLSLKCGGDDYTEALIRYVRRKYNVELGEISAEEAKEAVGSVMKRKNDIYTEVKGKNLLSGLPVGIKLHANETVEAFEEVTSQIIQAINGVLEEAPPELVNDVAREGLMLTGGGSKIAGMQKLIATKSQIKVVASEEAESLVALGTGLAGKYIMVQEEIKKSQMEEE